MLKKVLTWAAIAFVIYYVSTDPTSAAHSTTAGFDWLKSAGHSVAQFLSHLGK